MDSRYKQIIGTHIQQCRESAGLTQQALGDLVGISSTSVSKMEHGITVPTLDNLIRILNVLDISADEIFYDVVKSSHLVKASHLDEKLKDLPIEERKQIMLVIETLINRS